MLDFLLLSQQCAPGVDPDTMRRLVQVESGFNPFAIGVVRASLPKQPKTHEEAVAAVRVLHSKGHNYSVGLAQVNVINFAAHGLDAVSAFDPCRNLRAGSQILTRCYRSALRRTSDPQLALRSAFSCYESGNFITGFKDGYVVKLVNANATLPRAGALSGTPLVMFKSKGRRTRFASHVEPKSETAFTRPTDALAF